LNLTIPPTIDESISVVCKKIPGKNSWLGDVMVRSATRDPDSRGNEFDYTVSMLLTCNDSG